MHMRHFKNMVLQIRAVSKQIWNNIFVLFPKCVQNNTTDWRNVGWKISFSLYAIVKWKVSWNVLLSTSINQFTI
jgi:hypothetical protein